MTLGTRKETYGFLLNLPLIGGIKKKVIQSKKRRKLVEPTVSFKTI